LLVYPFFCKLEVIYNKLILNKMKKTVFFIVIILISNHINSQRRVSYEPFHAADYDYIKQNMDPIDGDVIGTPYLFKNFKNIGIIENDKNQKFLIKNINIDLLNGNFIYQLDSKNIYVFTTVNKLNINKDFYIKKNNNIYKILFKGNTFSIYKQFKVKLKPKVLNPLTYEVQRKAEWQIKESYFVEEKSNFKQLKFNKKSILSLFEKAKQNDLKKYIKEHHLSYKVEKDIISVIKYIDKITN